mmetsp:Transcript_32029/g.74882  ORF Transcript_32029/g.74882 Transcript_32029/m.74882 type:complete len:335 (+) Transcript_32029:446-1450(+)
MEVSRRRQPKPAQGVAIGAARRRAALVLRRPTSRDSLQHVRSRGDMEARLQSLTPPLHGLSSTTPRRRAPCRPLSRAPNGSCSLTQPADTYRFTEPTLCIQRNPPLPVKAATAATVAPPSRTSPSPPIPTMFLPTPLSIRLPPLVPSASPPQTTVHWARSEEGGRALPRTLRLQRERGGAKASPRASSPSSAAPKCQECDIPTQPAPRNPPPPPRPTPPGSSTLSTRREGGRAMSPRTSPPFLQPSRRPRALAAPRSPSKRSRGNGTRPFGHTNPPLLPPKSPSRVTTVTSSRHAPPPPWPGAGAARAAARPRRSSCPTRAQSTRRRGRPQKAR